MGEEENGIPSQKPTSGYPDRLIVIASILSKHRLWIIAPTAIAALMSVLFSVLTILLPPERSPLPNRYTASATILVQQTENPGLSTVYASLGLSGSDFSRISGSTDEGLLIVEILRSRTILDAIADEFEMTARYKVTTNVRSRTRKAILQNASFTYNSKNGILEISYTDIDPAFASDVANRMVELLTDWYAERGGTRNRRLKELLEEKLGEVTQEITVLEDAIRAFQRRYGVLTIEELAATRSALTGDLRTQLLLKEMEIKNYSRFSTIEDPVLTKLKAERENLIALLQDVDRGILNPDQSGYFRAEDLPTLSMEFNRLRTDLEIQRKIYEVLAQQYELVKLSTGDVSVVQIMENAETPDQKSGPSRGRICALVTAFVFLAACLLILFVEQIRRMGANKS